MSVVPVVVVAGGIRQRKIVAAFRAAGATRPDRAATAESLGVDEGHTFRTLCRDAILRDAGERRLYLDESALEAHEQRRHRFAATLIMTVVAAAAAAFAWASLR